MPIQVGAKNESRRINADWTEQGNSVYSYFRCRWKIKLRLWIPQRFKTDSGNVNTSPEFTQGIAKLTIHDEPVSKTLKGKKNHGPMVFFVKRNKSVLGSRVIVYKS